jgi:hypothetical protein
MTTVEPPRPVLGLQPDTEQPCYGGLNPKRTIVFLGVSNPRLVRLQAPEPARKP